MKVVVSGNFRVRVGLRVLGMGETEIEEIAAMEENLCLFEATASILSLNGQHRESPKRCVSKTEEEKIKTTSFNAYLLSIHIIFFSSQVIVFNYK